MSIDWDPRPTFLNASATWLGASTWICRDDGKLTRHIRNIMCHYVYSYGGVTMGNKGCYFWTSLPPEEYLTNWKAGVYKVKTDAPFVLCQLL